MNEANMTCIRTKRGKTEKQKERKKKKREKKNVKITKWNCGIIEGKYETDRWMHIKQKL